MDTKKLLIICGGIVGGFLLLLLIIWLISLAKPKYVTYETLEKKMVTASKNYVKDNESQFTTDNTKYNISYQVLVNGEYIKPIDELIKDYEGCSAVVTVIRNNGEYTYVPYLNCGDKYTTIELYKQVLKDNKVVNSNSGLYRDVNGGYYFRGKNLNNYIAFGTDTSGSKATDYIWQIISIGRDNSIKIRATFNLKYNKTQWDDRYNVNKKLYSGYNNFDDSILHESLTKVYDNKIILNDEQRSKLIPRRLCIGHRSDTDESKDGSTECSVLSKNYYYFGTITAYEILRISTDANCKTIKDESCSNFNFLSQNDQSSEWIITASTENDYEAYTFDGSIIEASRANGLKNLYLTAELNEYSFYKSGDGSLDNPYRLKLSNGTEETTKK